MKLNLKIILTILIVSTILGLIINALNSKGISLTRKERNISWVDDSLNNESGNIDSDKPKDDGFDEAKAITLKKAYELYNENVLFIDARDFVEYEIGHIKGAISLPYYDFDDYTYQLKNIPEDKPLVVYCDGKECDLSILLGDKLFEMGYKKVYIFFGGWVDWQLAKYPTEGNDE